MRIGTLLLIVVGAMQVGALGQTVFDTDAPKSPPRTAQSQPSSQPSEPDPKAEATKDPIRAKLAVARSAQEEAAKAARDALVNSIDESMKAVAQAGDLNGVTALKAERKAFEESGTLPTSPRLRAASAEYQKSLKQASATLDKAYDQAIKDLTKALKIDDAEAVRAEWQQTQRPTPAPAVAVPAPPKPPAAGAIEYTFYEWKKGDAPVKMIHRDEGFCYLVGINGALAGGGESVQITIENDGYWYLKCRSVNSQPLNVRAVSVKLPRK